MNKTQAIEIFQKNDGLLRTTEAIRQGIHPRTLYQLRDEGIVQQLTRGVYRLTSLPPLTQPDLVIVSLRVPRAVISLVSALAFHETTNEIPHEVHITLPRGTRPPKLDYPPLRIFSVTGAALTEGIETIKLDGVDVRIYNLPKTVVDCFRFRNKIGIDVAVAALSDAVQRRGIRPAQILHYARLCRIERVILPYLQAIQINLR